MKKISEMTPDEALTEQALAVFKRRLEQARKKAVESAAATKAVFDALEDMCIDPDEIPSTAENAENLEEAICCFIRPSPIHADEKERVLRCECFTPIPEDEEGENEKV